MGAKIDLKFIDSVVEDDFIKCEFNNSKSDSDIIFSGDYQGEEFEIYLDISTAIKFAKTLRTEINKAKKEMEVGNG